MNISQIKEKIRATVPKSQNQIQCLVYAFITYFNLDDDIFIFSLKW